MSEPITLALIIGAAVGGVVEALAGKAVDKATALGQRIGQLVNRQQTMPLSQYDAAVRRAVAEARQELLEQYEAGGAALPADVVADMTALLDHPPFAEEVARRLLYRGQPDWERLAGYYLDRRGAGDTAAASARWQALELPLSDFFAALERRLTADREIGPLLRDAATLASLARLEGLTEIIAQASRQVQDSLPAVQRAAERGADTLDALLQQSGQQTAFLSQIADLVRSLAPATAVPAAGAAASLTAEERATLRLLRDECNRLPLAHDPRAAGDRGPRAELARVYVDLQTTTPPTWALVCDRLGVPADARRDLERRLRAEMRERTGRLPEEAPDLEALQVEGLLRREGRTDFDRHPLRPWAKDEAALRAALQPTTALEALARQRRLVLLGIPGSGKTTFVNHLAFTLAGVALGEEADWQATLGGELSPAPFPLRVVVRRWSAGLTVHSQPGVELAYAALQAAGGYADRARLLQRLESPDTLVFFDGLDEARAGDPEAEDPAERLDRRQVIVKSVQDFCVAHPHCRVLITSRIKPYEGPYRLEGLPAFTLAELDDPRIERFARRWYDELARVGQMSPEEAGRKREQLLRALGRRPALREMAGTPLLLTMLARVNARKDLPESRAELYHDCVQQLLWEWERPKEGVQSLDGLVQEAEAEARRVDSAARLDKLRVEQALWRLAYEAHGRGGRRTAELPVAAVRSALAAVHPLKHRGRAWASRVTALMQERGGLLVASDEETFTFPHPSFEEYLAARHLLGLENRSAAAAERAASADWREVVLLACGYLASQGLSSDLEGLVAELAACPTDRPEGRRALLTAGQAWLEFGPRPAVSHLGRKLADELPAALTRLMQNGDLEARERLEAGLLAADLGALPADLDELVAAPDWGFAI
ncbi:MAG: hypothetical protein RMN53_17720, partial [Anaerolineae bacterium]|nr:hypothetical protein [Anaerolineae bacterium]